MGGTCSRHRRSRKLVKCLVGIPEGSLDMFGRITLKYLLNSMSVWVGFNNVSVVDICDYDHMPSTFTKF